VCAFVGRGGGRGGFRGGGRGSSRGGGFRGRGKPFPWYANNNSNIMQVAEVADDSENNSELKIIIKTKSL
jgi:hypothetical protein